MVRRQISLRSSSSFTLAALFTVLLVLSILTILYFMWVASGTNKRHEVTAIIKTDMAGLEDTYRTSGIEAVADILQYRLKNPQKGHIYILADAEKHVFLGNFAYIPDAAMHQKFISPKKSVFEFLLPRGTENTGLSPKKSYEIMAIMRQLPNGYHVLVGRNLPDTDTQNTLMGRLGWAMIIILSLLAAAGFFISDRVVYRINLIGKTATEIMHTGDLSRRIPVPGKWDDLSVLAHILNELFARVESLMIGVRQVSDNVAHDLRTPLTRIKNQLEALHARSETENLPITEATEKLISDADHLLATFSALLRIGNIESGKWQSALEHISLDALIADVIEFYEPLASDKEQIVQSTLAPVTYKADKHLMFQAIANLIDNAIKYAPVGGTVSVTLEQRKKHIRIIITDSGKGVEKEDYEAIFRRFYRTDKVRNKSGHGLGLSLVKAIAELHNGTIKASHVAQNFAITITLPVK